MIPKHGASAGARTPRRSHTSKLAPCHCQLQQLVKLNSHLVGSIPTLTLGRHSLGADKNISSYPKITKNLFMLKSISFPWRERQLITERICLMTLPRSKCQSSFCELAVPRVFSAGRSRFSRRAQKPHCPCARVRHNPPMLARVLSPPSMTRRTAAARQPKCSPVSCTLLSMEWKASLLRRRPIRLGDANLVIAGPPNAAVKESRDRAKGWEFMSDPEHDFRTQRE